MFKSCETGEESDALHIFATNNEVDHFNLQHLHAICPESVTIKARDYERNSETGRLQRKDGHHHKVYNTCLQKYIHVGIGARIMLVKNIDVSDGLVNGAFGTIVNMVGNCPDSEGDNDYLPISIHVAFDDPKVGQKQRSKTRTIDPEGRTITILQPEEDKVTNNGGLRRQYPIRLAWACTVHKVQGLTIDKVVVSLKKIFSSGQAYVALSRVTSLSGLTIKDFKQSAIYCNAKVAEATSKMQPFISPLSSASIKQSDFTIILHNTQSLKGHFPDVRANVNMNKADCICLTETWLGVDDPPHLPCLTGFQFTHLSRGHSYDDTHPRLQQLKQDSHGGVGIYHSLTKDVVIWPSNCYNIECLIFQVNSINLTAAVLYRPAIYPVTIFCQHLKRLLDVIDQCPGKKIIMGDLNENALENGPLLNFLAEHNYTQYVQTATTDKGTLIDHVYVKDAANILVDVLPVYYSYHEMVRITLV